MRAIVFAEKNKVEIWKDLACNPIQENQVKLQTLYSGVTVGTERGILMGSDLPHIAGYQTVSTVVETGRAVKDVKVGDNVFSDYSEPPAGHINIGGCGHMEIRVRETSGNFMIIPEKFVLEQAALLGVMGIGIKASKRGSVKMHDKVLVIGLGIIGQACAQASLAMGADVYGMDLMPERIQLAEKLSCTRAWNASCRDVWSEIAAHGPYDVIFETTGLTEMYNNSFKVIRKGISRIMAVGMRSKMEYEFWKLGHLSEATIVHTEHFRKEELEDLFRLVPRNRIDIASLITHRVAVDDAPAVYDKIIHNPSGLMGIVFGWE